MTVYIGVDFHARQQTISYLTTEDGEIQRLQLEHSQPETVRAFYEQFAGQRVIVGRINWGQACDLRFYHPFASHRSRANLQLNFSQSPSLQDSTC